MAMNNINHTNIKTPGIAYIWLHLTSAIVLSVISYIILRVFGLSKTVSLVPVIIILIVTIIYPYSNYFTYSPISLNIYTKRHESRYKSNQRKPIQRRIELITWLMVTVLSLTISLFSIVLRHPVDSIPSIDSLFEPQQMQIASTTTTPDVEGIVMVAGLNLRHGPGIDYAVVTILSRGTQFTVISRDEDGQWLRIILDSGQSGWVNANSNFVETSAALEDIPIELFEGGGSRPGS